MCYLDLPDGSPLASLASRCAMRHAHTSLMAGAFTLPPPARLATCVYSRSPSMSSAWIVFTPVAPALLHDTENLLVTRSRHQQEDPHKADLNLRAGPRAHPLWASATFVVFVGARGVLPIINTKKEYDEVGQARAIYVPLSSLVILYFDVAPSKEPVIELPVAKGEIHVPQGVYEEGTITTVNRAPEFIEDASTEYSRASPTRARAERRASKIGRYNCRNAVDLDLLWSIIETVEEAFSEIINDVLTKRTCILTEASNRVELVSLPTGVVIGRQGYCRVCFCKPRRSTGSNLLDAREPRAPPALARGYSRLDLCPTSGARTARGDPTDATWLGCTLMKRDVLERTISPNLESHLIPLLPTWKATSGRMRPWLPLTLPTHGTYKRLHAVNHFSTEVDKNLLTIQEIRAVLVPVDMASPVVITGSLMLTALLRALAPPPRAGL
ncbi:hypothetical protein NM688_g5931 [Phlebia brevispora]|uniref:Uncharacterized protein n=1 Tax=Phlebia brevispora TaxID=194682 RepID=A0ACC1SMN4_9APHY|nr:hypothetical protein NM688_g5931 [Phlebia brevispora]